MLKTTLKQLEEIEECRAAALALFRTCESADQLDETLRLLMREVSICAETAAREIASSAGHAADGVDSLDSPRSGGGAVYCP